MNFDESAKDVEQWLLATCNAARTLSPTECAAYKALHIRKGWEVTIGFKTREGIVHLLLDSDFPYSPPRVAYRSGDCYLKWPHVEENGVLCLPKNSVSWTDPIEKVRVALADACVLVDGTLHLDPSTTELSREFISYWNRAVDTSVRKIQSLLEPTRSAGEIAVWWGKDEIVAAENGEQLTHWLRNSGSTAEVQFTQGIFIRLDAPWVPPYPESLQLVVDKLRAVDPDVPGKLETHAIDNERCVVVMAASVETGTGLTGIIIEGGILRKLNGFRPKHIPRNFKIPHWYQNATVNHSIVNRADAAWIHGRDKNEELAETLTKKVTILGCGALGSHVAVRLAQAGVGSLMLCDPETLAAANVGRHVLGMRSVGRSKSLDLANEIRRRFPHLTVEGHHTAWQHASDEVREKIWASDLIICAIGDWSSEGLLNEEHRVRGVPPIIYCWMEEHATAAHAVGIVNQSSCIACLLNETGNTAAPETIWNDGAEEVSEPACGAYFQPFGPVDIAYAEGIAAELAVDILTGRVAENVHRVHATSTHRLKKLGGDWSEAHKEFRGHFEGGLQFQRPIENSSECPLCNPVHD